MATLEDWSGRGPGTRHTLRRIRAAGVEIGTVIDVGVLTGTPKLRDELPDAHHILIEPSPAHKDAIERNYKGVSHELLAVAASDVDADAFLVDRAIDGGTRVTHSTVVDTRAEVEALPNKIAVHNMPLRRLDTIMEGVKAPGEILLKIDVDGHEMKVLAGAPETLRRAAFVSIEAPRDALLERTKFLADAGFRLFDIVDICYYRGALWQVDLIFVRGDLRDSVADLRPSPADRDDTFDLRAYREFNAEPRVASSASAVDRSSEPAHAAEPRRQKSAASRLWKRIRGR